MKTRSLEEWRGILCQDVQQSTNKEELVEKLFAAIVSIQEESKGHNEPDACNRELVAAILKSDLEDKTLAKQLILWAVEPHKDIPDVKNNTPYSGLHSETKNATARNLMAKLCVYQYSYGKTNSAPSDRKKGTLNHCNTEQQGRAQKLLEFFRVNNELLKGTVLHGINTLEMMNTNIYTSFDNYRKNASAYGVYDMEPENCPSSDCCRGVFWGHYEKINKVHELLRRSVANSRLWYITGSRRQTLLGDQVDQGLMYRTSREVQNLVDKINMDLAQGDFPVAAARSKRVQTTKKNPVKKQKGPVKKPKPERKKKN